jgi:hypothetical protein
MPDARTAESATWEEPPSSIMKNLHSRISCTQATAIRPELSPRPVICNFQMYSSRGYWGSLIGPAAVGLTLRSTVVPSGATVLESPTLGSLIGPAAVGLTFRCTVVVSRPNVGAAPADLLAPRSISGLAVGLTFPGRPRCATPTPVRSPNSIPQITIFLIPNESPFITVAL